MPNAQNHYVLKFDHEKSDTNSGLRRFFYTREVGPVSYKSALNASVNYGSNISFLTCDEDLYQKLLKDGLILNG